MVKYKEAKAKISIALISAAFAVLAAIFILIGYKNEVLGWMKTTGTVVLVISLPVFLYMVYSYLMKKIKEM